MPQRILALEVNDAEIKAALVETTFRDYRISGFFREPLAEGDGTAEEQVRRFLAEHKLAGDTVLSSLPGDRVTWRTLFLPFRDRKKLAQTVPFELENHVPFGLDEVIVDFQILSRDSNGTTVLAALVPKTDLDRHLSLLRSAGLDPKIVDVSPLSTLNALNLVADLPPGFVFIDLGARTVSVALYRSRALAGLRTVSYVAAAHSGNGTATGRARDAVSGLLAEIRWTVLALNGGPLESDLPCLLAGDPADCDVMERELADALGVDVRRLDRMRLRSVGPQMRESAPAFASSLGLALREVAPGSSLGVNFRRGEFSYHRAQQELRRSLGGLAALASVVVALTVADVVVDYRVQANRADLLARQVREVFKSTLPDLPSRDPIGELQAEIENLQRRFDDINDIIPVANSTGLDILLAISQAVPKNVRLDADDYTMDADAVRMRGNTDTFEAVDTIKQRLLANTLFRDVQVRDAKADPGGHGVNFRLTIVLAKNAGDASETAQ